MNRIRSVRTMCLLVLALSLGSSSILNATPPDQALAKMQRNFLAQFPSSLPINRIAVFPIKDDEQGVVRGSVERALVSMGNYQILERQAIDQLYQEEVFQLGSDVDPSTISAPGKRLGAEAVVIGSYIECYGFGRIGYKATLKLIIVETGHIQWSQEIYGSEPVIWHYVVVVGLFLLIFFWVRHLLGNSVIKQTHSHAERIREEMLKSLKKSLTEFRQILDRGRGVLDAALLTKMSTFKTDLDRLIGDVTGAEYGMVNASESDAAKKVDQARSAMIVVKELYGYINGFSQTVPDHPERAAQEFVRIQECLRRIRSLL